MTPLCMQIEGVGFWAETAPDWATARALLTTQPALPAVATAPSPGAEETSTHQRPTPSSLSPNERRRAPLSVLLALSAAEQALLSSGLCARATPSVFASNFGDLPTVDAVCEALAHHPELLSPTRFHHSVHNVASGYWAMGQRSHAPSTAVSAAPCSFAAGLWEAMALSLDESQPVLLVAYDVPALGPLARLSPCSGMAALALVLQARRMSPSPAVTHGLAAFAVQLLPDDASPCPPKDHATLPAPGLPLPSASAERLGLQQHPLRLALPLMECMALPQTPGCTLAFKPGQNLHLSRTVA